MMRFSARQDGMAYRLKKGSESFTLESIQLPPFGFMRSVIAVHCCFSQLD
jgi:hypothetical protein